jgi:hypothetical protein
MNTEGNDPTYPDNSSSGLTKREYFAAMALQGILSDPEEIKMEGEYEEEEMEEGEEGEEMESEGGDMENRRKSGESCVECACRLAVEHADMLIRQLNK